MAKTIARARDVAKVRNVNRDIKKNVRELRPGGRWLPYAIPRDASPGVLRRNQSGHEAQQHAHSVCCCFTPTVGQLLPKNVSVSAWCIRRSAGEARGQTTAARPGLSPSLRHRPWSQAVAVEREGGGGHGAASAGRCNLARTSLPLLAGPIQPRRRRHVTLSLSV